MQDGQEDTALSKDDHAFSSADVMAVFAAGGLRTTRPRRLIAETIAALAADGQDFTAEALRQRVQEQDMGIGRATVFRALDALLDGGLLQRIRFADGSHRFKACGHRAMHHHHLTCSICHRVVDVDACFPDDRLRTIADEAGFSLEGHTIDLYGRCASCRLER